MTISKQVFVRSQHSVGSSANRFGGPDTYVVVVTGPEPLNIHTPLHRDRLARKGYTITYCGEGYSRHSGPRSALGRALAHAAEIVSTEVK